MAPRPSLLRLQSALWLLLAACAPEAAAVPFARADDLRAAGYGYLLPRQCDQFCGYNNMYCCEAGTQCTTSNGIAGCSAAAGGGYAWYTTTWTVTQTYTKTYNSFIPAATAPAGSEKCVPPEGSGQIACGNICCAKWQYCAYDGQCMANIAAPVPIPSTGNIMTSAGPAPVTTAFSAPYRVTSGTGTATGTGAFATSTDGVSPGGEESGGGGLSGGAIAGIVVGTIAGVALLLLICACCVARGLWHGLLAVLGIGKKKESSSGHSHRDSHGGWFGGGGGRPSSASGRKEKSGKGVGLLGLGAALGTLALLLGLRRDKKKKSAGTARTRSDIGSGSYSWSQSYTATSPSESLPSSPAPRRYPNC